MMKEYKLLPCNYLSRSEEGVKVESSEYACDRSYLWGYSTVFLVGINNVLPFVFLIIANVYVVVKLCDNADLAPTGS